MRPTRTAAPRRRPAVAAEILDGHDSSLLDLVDNLLSRGVLLNGELILALADVDLVYLRLSLLFCAADRVLPTLGLKPRRRWRRRR